MNAHKYDRLSGGCVCGSAWIRDDWNACSDQVGTFVKTWMDAQAAYVRFDEIVPEDDPYFECGHGHMRCTRH